MSAIKMILLCIAVILCIAISAGATYYVVENRKQAEINTLREEYREEIDTLGELLTCCENNNNNLTEEIITKETEVENLNQSLQENASELEKLRSGNNYELHDPTYLEFINFIAQDKTDEEEYIDDVFDCEHFAQMLNNNSEAQGIRCAYVMVNFGSVGHAIVGFNTVDHGMVYVEVQNDELVENLEVGKEYWTECVIPNGDYYYEDAPDDTITDIIIVW